MKHAIRALALFAICLPAFAQAYIPLPWPRGVFFYDSDGSALAGGKVYAYLAGTTTPVSTYPDATSGVPNTWPVVLDTGGAASIWLKTSNGPVKIAVYDSLNNLQYTVDHVPANGSLTGAALVLTSGVGSVTLQASGSSSTWTLTLPPTPGTSGYVLTTNGTGTTSWSPPAPAAGSNSQLQFNSAGSLGADSNLYWNTVLGQLNITDPWPAGVIAPIFNATATGSNNAFQTQASSAYITGGGNIGAQSLALAYGLTVGNASSGGSGGIYGLTALGVLNVASCTGCGATPAGPTAAIQFNNSGLFGGNATFTFNNSLGQATVTGGSSSGFIAPVFNSSLSASSSSPAFQTGGGTSSISGSGYIAAQGLALPAPGSGGTLTVNGVGGFSGTKTAGTCTITFALGIATSVSGC